MGQITTKHAYNEEILRSLRLLLQRSDASVTTRTQPPPTAPVVAEGQRALAAAQAEAADLKVKLQEAEQKIADLEKLCKKHEKSSQTNANMVSKLTETVTQKSSAIASLKAQVAEQGSLLERYKEHRSELRADVAAKCMSAQPLGSLTYSAILKKVSTASTAAQARQIISSAYWPQDDVTTMVTTGLAGSISNRRCDLARAGLPREAVVNIESLYASYSLLSTPTSMHEQVVMALERLHVDVVTASSAKVDDLRGLSDGGKAMQAKHTSRRLNNRLAAMVSRQRFTLVSQIRQLAEEMGLPIASMEEIEDMARKGTWRKKRPTGPVPPRQAQSARQQQQPPLPSQSPQSHSRRRSRARSRSTNQETPPSSSHPVVDDQLQRLINSYQDELDSPDA
ncbi:hypothetical protein H4S07_001396 [Coemansia furcata]|uniref:Uncharacterized protein n=1 Tax=Coemansia furcata TaxID=417177 RepID=A0ACC1LPE3_9FUNG|nr:hypothetical protein H4S07_001396 [Coemansia furcata]